MKKTILLLLFILIFTALFSGEIMQQVRKQAARHDVKGLVHTNTDRRDYIPS